MDNVTHGLLGWTVSRCLPEERWDPRWAVPVSILAANLPDFEVLVVPMTDKAYYLTHHRGWSHSLLGIAGEVVAFTIVVYAMIRMVARGKPANRDGPTELDRATPRFVPVLLLVGVQAYLHLFLDWWNTYGVRPLYPFDPRWFYGDLVFIIDPWIWLTLAGSLILGSRWIGADRRLLFFWLFLGTLTSSVVVFAVHDRIVPAVVAVAWFTTIGVVALLRRRSVRRPRLVATIALLAVSGYVAGLGLSGERSLRLAIAEHNSPARQVMSSMHPVPAIPWRFEVVVEDRGRLHQYGVDIWRETSKERPIRDQNLGLVEEYGVGDDPRVEAWQSFARHPIVELEVASKASLVLGDVRYRVLSARADWTAQRIEIDKRHSAGRDP